MQPRRGPTHRHGQRTFEPTPTQRRAILDAEAQWRELQDLYAQPLNDAVRRAKDEKRVSPHFSDADSRIRLKAAAKEMAACLSELHTPEGAALVRAPLLAAMQDLSGFQPQHVLLDRLSTALEVVVLLEKAAAQIAPGPGPKAPTDQVAFLERAAANWLRDTGQAPTAKGAFLHTIHACAHDPALASLTPGRVEEVLRRLGGNSASQ